MKAIVAMDQAAGTMPRAIDADRWDESGSTC